MKTTELKLKAPEGVKFNMPNGDPALEILTHRNITVQTVVSNNRVRVIIDFDRPFLERHTK